MSRLLANSISLTQFTVTGQIPGTEDIFPIISSALSRFAFQSIDNTVDQVSTGWTHLDDTAVATFDNPGVLWIDKFLIFSLRRDVRRIPAAVLKAEQKKEEDAFLAQHPNLRRCPKIKRLEIKELVSARLLSKTLPVPTVSDVVWDTKAGIIHLTANSSKAIDLFENAFKKTFPEFQLRMIVPYHRAEQAAIESDLVSQLASANQAGTDALISLIGDNQWIGRDFLLWLLAGCSESCFSGFSAWIDSRLVMIGKGEEGIQKITVAGEVADRLPTIKTALQDGKQITSATIYIENTDGGVYRFTLAGDTFILNGFKTPTVRLDGQVDDGVSEFQAVVLEKMHLVNTGMGYLGDLLRAFLRDRLTEGRWVQRYSDIQVWMGGEE